MHKEGFKYNNHHRDRGLFRALQLNTIKYLFNKIVQKFKRLNNVDSTLNFKASFKILKISMLVVDWHVISTTLEACLGVLPVFWLCGSTPASAIPLLREYSHKSAVVLLGVLPY